MEQIIQKRFKKSIPTYNSQAIVQQSMARHLADELSRIQQHFEEVYEFGAGTGLLTKQMVDLFVIQKYIINDLCVEMEDSLIPILKQNEHIHPILYFGNAEYLPIPEALDLVVSNAAIQWFSKQQDFISRLATAMKKDSFFAFTTFAENNLIQCKKILDKGINYPSISNMDIQLENYFEIIYAAEEENVLWFSSPMDILRHLKETGVNSFSQTQTLIENETDLFQKWTRSSLNQFTDLYHDLFFESGQYPLTYNPVYRIVKRK